MLICHLCQILANPSQCLFDASAVEFLHVQDSAYLPLPSSNSCPSQCLFDASAIEFLQVQDSDYSLLPSSHSCPSQCLFATSAVEFLQDSFPASVVEFLVQVSADSPLPSSNSCKPSQRSPESLCCRLVLILAGSVCFIWDFFWYKSTHA